jgi:chromosome segregation ATPase
MSSSTSAHIHPIISASRGLLDRIEELERIRMAYIEEIKSETQSKMELQQELDSTKSRLKYVEDSLFKSEEEKAMIQNKLLQAKSVKSKIEDGMKALLDTLERDQRVVQKISVNNDQD